MELLHRILRAAVEGGASDVHLKIGSPVTLRVNRQLLTIEAPTPTADWINNIIERIVPKHGRPRLEEEREVDFSYFAPGLGRFRTNVFQQRGEFCLALRFVKTSVPSLEELGLDTPSFENALKHVLRQDPDIIMIGEMRDAISFSAAMSAADTGHLVLSTLHTINSAQSVNRILDFFHVEEREQIRRQLAGTLQAVVCQRMVATINGGVTPAQEILINTGLVRRLIEENRLEKLPAAIETGVDDGMQNFNQALFQLVKDGKVAEKEALAKATNAQALEMNFKGIFLDEARRILS